MLFYPANNVIFEYVYYDEPSSVLFVKYTTRGIDEYFKLDRVFFHSTILPLLRKDEEFRNMLYWGMHNELVIQLDENIPDFELADLNKFSCKG